MRQMAYKFPEVISVGATYGTNINRYRLFSFMVTDKFGCGTFAQHALIDGESTKNLQCAIVSFKLNYIIWANIKVIVIDKDFSEMAILTQEFPSATILLCQFDVIDYLRPEVSKKQYGFNEDNKMHIKNILLIMIRTDSESTFEKYLSALNVLCQKYPSFIQYFNCKEKWCSYLRGNIPHLRNNTNNRLKASWGALKDLLHRHLPMDECIQLLFFLQQLLKISTSKDKKKVGFRYIHTYDHEMQDLAIIATHYACNLVEEQYKLSSNSVYNISVNENSSCVVLTSERSGALYTVDWKENNCNCSFFMTVLLLCRHIIYLRRKKLDVGTIIAINSIPSRWMLSENSEEEFNACRSDSILSYYVEDIQYSKYTILNQNENFYDQMQYVKELQKSSVIKDQLVLMNGLVI